MHGAKVLISKLICVTESECHFRLCHTAKHRRHNSAIDDAKGCNDDATFRCWTSATRRTNRFVERIRTMKNVYGFRFYTQTHTRHWISDDDCENKGKYSERSQKVSVRSIKFGWITWTIWEGCGCATFCCALSAA